RVAALGTIVEKRGIPLYDREIILEVGEVDAQGLDLFGGHQATLFAQHEARERRTVLGEQLPGIHRLGERIDRKDEVVLEQRRGGVVQARRIRTQHLLERVAGDLFERRIVAQAPGERGE